MISKTMRAWLLMIVFSVMSVTELWLVDAGHSNEFGLLFAVAFFAGAVLSAMEVIKLRKQSK